MLIQLRAKAKAKLLILFSRGFKKQIQVDNLQMSVKKHPMRTCLCYIWTNKTSTKKGFKIMKREECLYLLLLLEPHSFRWDASNLLKILRKLCVSTKFRNQKIGWSWAFYAVIPILHQTNRLRVPILVRFKLWKFPKSSKVVKHCVKLQKFGFP